MAFAASLAMTDCGGGGTSPSPAPNGSSTGALLDTAFQCPTSATVSTSAARSSDAGEAFRRPVNRPPAATSPATTMLAVTYSTRSLAAAVAAAGEARAGVTFLHQLDFDALGTSVRLVAVPAGQATAAAAALRGTAGVVRVAPAGSKSVALTVAAPAWPNDPYFNGFQTTVAPSAGATPPPPTYRLLPYVEAANVPGQWDLHAIGLGYALAYAQSANGSTIVNANAAGSPNVRIAIIDTGEDAAHPELAGKIVSQHCFITGSSGRQSTGIYTIDQAGHGTDVAGIAAAASGNGLGFSGAGGASAIDAFRVFPTPDDACSTPGSTDTQCEANTVDVASAINTAVALGDDVISMSLGGGSCAGGVDPDDTQGQAVANAIAHGVVVVAASGNAGGPVYAPACDAGVIAVGASALDDGQPNGSGHAGGTATAPVEYVASYSNAGPTNAAGNPADWGIVAPGGDPKPDPNAANDPTGATADGDDLHWIENVWTTTPLDTTFGTLPCKPDYANPSGPGDCRVLIAGTSMAAPHVAGVAALIIAAAPAYKSPAAMKSLLCRSADDIGDPHQGCGRLNAYRAMALALGDPSPP